MDKKSSVRPILLIEDNPMDLDLTLQAFKESGLTNPVEVCRDGEEALDYIESHTSETDDKLPIIVLLDLRLPKIDGIEVLEEVKENDVWKRIPFIVMTTSREDKDVDRAYSLGANSYIVKPISFEAFTEVVTMIKHYWLTTNESPFK